MSTITKIHTPANDTDPAAHGAALQETARQRLNLLAEVIRVKGLMTISPDKGRELEVLFEWGARGAAFEHETADYITCQYNAAWRGADDCDHLATIRMTRTRRAPEQGYRLTLSHHETF